MKSETCFGKVSGEPLTKYDFEYEALEAAEYSEIQFGHELVPYSCRKCGQWHLSPKSRQTPTKTCEFCTAADGSFKESYKTKADAKTRSKIIKGERGIHLAVYQCKHGSGWHLTKDNEYITGESFRFCSNSVSLGVITNPVKYNS